MTSKYCFYHIKPVTEFYIEMPEQWEKDMLKKYLERITEYNSHHKIISIISEEANKRKIFKNIKKTIPLEPEHYSEKNNIYTPNYNSIFTKDSNFYISIDFYKEKIEPFPADYHAITLTGNYEKIFKNYIKNLKIKAKTSEFQIYGIEIISEGFFKIYKLSSDKILLLAKLNCRIKVENKSNNNKYYKSTFNHIKIFSSADEFIIQLKGKVSEKKLQEWRSILIENGFNFNDLKRIK